LEKNKIIKPGGFMNINVVGITATIKEFLEMPENNSWHKRKLGCEARNKEDFISLKKFISDRHSTEEHCHQIR
jgi:hypothetical protein